jgi:hypothetical protein
VGLTKPFDSKAAGARVLATTLVLCLLVLSGLVYAQSVPHATHHAHHKPATHATVLCSWMCAAGQVLDGAPFSLPAVSGLVAILAVPVSDAPFAVALPSPASRGPPQYAA